MDKREKKINAISAKTAYFLSNGLEKRFFPSRSPGSGFACREWDGISLFREENRAGIQPPRHRE